MLDKKVALLKMYYCVVNRVALFSKIFSNTFIILKYFYSKPPKIIKYPKSFTFEACYFYDFSGWAPFSVSIHFDYVLFKFLGLIFSSFMGKMQYVS